MTPVLAAAVKSIRSAVGKWSDIFRVGEGG